LFQDKEKKEECVRLKLIKSASFYVLFAPDESGQKEPNKSRPNQDSIPESIF
jgi:hypothetical protein